MSNMSAIGFGGSTSEAFEATMEEALRRAVAPAELGEWAKGHRVFLDPSGAAIALHLDENAIKCVTPFFSPSDGGTTWRVQTSAPHLDKECQDCSGADCDIVDPTSSEMVTRSAVQWVYFDAYEAWLGHSRTYDLQVAGFASALNLCATEDEWEAAQAAAFGGTRAPGARIEPDEPLRLADEAFMPHGMFDNDGCLGKRARALVTGRVEKLTHPTNGLTGDRFTWARIHTICGLLDIVSPYASGTLFAPGMRALAEIWLVGRPVEPPPAPEQKRGWWLKLFRG